jgi:hypothetical protein
MKIAGSLFLLMAGGLASAVPAGAQAAPDATEAAMVKSTSIAAR